MKLEVKNIQGESTGKKIDLPKDIFGIEPNDHAIYLDVKRYLTNQRQGTHSAKERAFVKGSTRKLRKQKGTGSARVGDIKNPLFRGGGRVFGPRPHDYSIKVNKKTRQLARKSALTYKMENKEVIVVEDFSFDEPKTKNYLNVLLKLNAGDKKSLLLIADKDDNVMLSARNLPVAHVSLASQLNTYMIMNSNALIISESGLNKIKESFKQGK